MSTELDSLESLIHTELMDLDALNSRMRGEGLPIVSTSVDATPGASVSSFKELQLSEVSELSNLTPEQIHLRIQGYKFEVWQKTVRMMECVRTLEQRRSEMTAEERRKNKASEGTAFNSKELVTPSSLRSSKRMPQSNEEKQAASMAKLLPNLNQAEIIELIRKGRGAAFQRGLAGGAGSPKSINTCPDCRTEYSGETHECPKATPRTTELPVKPVVPTETFAEKIARLRAATAAAKANQLATQPVKWSPAIQVIRDRVVSIIQRGEAEPAYFTTVQLVRASRELGNIF